MKDIIERNVRARSDGELYAMLHLQRENWSDEALQIAADEWSQRALDETQFAHAVEKAKGKVQADDAPRSEPLETNKRVLFFVLGFFACFGFPVVLTYVMYKMRGLDRKYHDAMTFMGYGFSLLVLSIVLTMMIWPS